MAKKLLNGADSCVDDALKGLSAVNPNVRIIPKQRVSIRHDYKQHCAQDKVAVVSGGGSGHEPFCAGYVGSGMLTAAVAGHVFASPPPGNIFTALHELGHENKAKILLLVLNYTGDCLNFGLAQERAISMGISSKMIICHDDCAQMNTESRAGQRGLCGVLFFIKISGAMAERGDKLDKIVDVLSTEVVPNVGSIGVSLTPCSLPGSAPLFHVKEDEIELGLGIHGEAGVKTIKMCSAAEVVSKMLNHMMDSKSKTRIDLNRGDKLALIINNLGGTSKIEELVVAKEAIEQLESGGMEVVRAYCGTLFTSLEMQGVQLSVLKIPNEHIILPLLDAPVSAPVWPRAYTANRKTPAPLEVQPNPTDTLEDAKIQPVFSKMLSEKFLKALQEVCKTLRNNEKLLNDYDSGSGDGDCGSTLINGVKGIEEHMACYKLDFTKPTLVFRHLANIAETRMGGASGALYGIFFTSLSNSLQDIDKKTWLMALKRAVKAIQTYGRAQVGDRTLLDALVPAIEKFEKDLDEDIAVILHHMAEVAEEGSKATINMTARAGRASYVSKKRLIHQDPGAVAVSLCLRAITLPFLQ